QDPGVEELARREYRDADAALITSGHRHHQRRHRHLGEVEVAELELAPEELRRKHLAGQEVDAVGLDAAVEDRPGARVLRHADAQLQARHSMILSARSASCSEIGTPIASAVRRLITISSKA